MVKTINVYDGQSRRVEKRTYGSGSALVAITRYLYDGTVAIAEYDGANTLVRTYTRGLDLTGSLQGAGGIGGLLATTNAAGQSDSYFFDGNGNVVDLSDAYGVVQAHYQYDPFGNLIAQTGSLQQSYQWSSKETDASTGLVSYLYRFYNPALQRWLNRDPLGEMGSTTTMAARTQLVNAVEGLITQAARLTNQLASLEDSLRTYAPDQAAPVLAYYFSLARTQASVSPARYLAMDAGNLYNFVFNNPINGVDPLGQTLLGGVAGFVNGATGGLLGQIFKGLYKYLGIDPCSQAYKNGTKWGEGAFIAANIVLLFIPVVDAVVAGVEFLAWAADAALAGEDLAIGGELLGGGEILGGGELLGGEGLVGGSELAAEEGLAAEGGGTLVRFGKNAESVEKLAADAARAAENGFPHGVSTIMRDWGFRGNRTADISEVQQFFNVTQTGSNAAHYTVELPSPVTQEVADLFNSLFK